MLKNRSLPKFNVIFTTYDSQAVRHNQLSEWMDPHSVPRFFSYNVQQSKFPVKQLSAAARIRVCALTMFVKFPRGRLAATDGAGTDDSSARPAQAPAASL